MGFLTDRFGPTVHASSADEGFLKLINRKTTSGKVVNEETALQNSAVFACIRIIAETLAMMPLQVFEETKSGRKTQTKEHPAAYVLSKQSNRHMTSMTFRDVVQGHVAGWGNGYAELQRNKKGEVVGLWPLLPDVTRAERIDESGDVIYRTKAAQDDSRILHLKQDQLIHVMGPGWNGYGGYSIVRLAREAIGLGMSAEEFGSRWFGQGTQGGHIVYVPGHLSPEGKENLNDHLQKEEAGMDNSHRWRILQEGMKVERIGLPPEDAQFLETRRFQNSDIARFFRMQLSKLQELQRQTHSNMEQSNLEFYMDTMLPWAVRWEQELDRKIFITNEERNRFYTKFNFSSLLRGDTASQGEFFHKATGGPWMTPDEVRAKLEMDPIPGGDKLRNPTNMMLGAMPDENPIT